MNNLKTIVPTIIITAIVVGGGVYMLQKNQVTQPVQEIAKQEVANPEVTKPVVTETPTTVTPTEPLSYSMTGVTATVSKSTAPFDYTAEQLKGMADSCGSQHDTGYFDQLVSKFSGETKTIYSFKYAGASQESDTYVVTLLPNKAGYTSLDQFKKDFDLCDAGGDAYPTMVNSNWLLFVNSCGSGFNDGSGNPVGCAEIQKIVEPTLKLN
jgi:hypothetical protein